jgi:TRAP-type mannitol/chloroaromatic compound transport system substrate-binding protein
MVAAVEEMSGGRFIIHAHPHGELVPAYEQTEAMRDGVLDLCHSDLGGDMALVGKKALLLGASGYPAGTTSEEDFAWIYTGGGMDIIADVFKDYGTPAGWLGEGQEVFCYSHKPLDTIESLNGIKFRTIGFWAEVMGTFGASVVTIAGSEVYPSAEKGVIDAFEYGGAALNWPMGFHEIMDYMGLPGIHSPGAGHPILANFNSWNALPDDLKAILQAAIEVYGNEWRASLIVDDSVALEKYKEYGTKIFTVSDELQAEIAKRSLDISMQYYAEEPGFAEVWDAKAAYVKLYKQGKDAITLKYSVFE